MANISIYSRTTKQRTSDFLILIHTRDKSQPGFLQVYLSYSVDEFDCHDPAAHRCRLMVLSVAVIHSDDPDLVSFLHDDWD